jgi:diaminopimelate epimerase
MPAMTATGPIASDAAPIAFRPSGTIPFWKMSGSGNDFVVVDNRTGLLPLEGVAEFTRRVCRHRVSVGAVGVVLIEDPAPAGEGEPPADFRWRYVNADGSDGELCGNGAMCGARFAVLNGIASHRCVFQTPSGPVWAEVAADPADPFVRIAIADPGPVLPARDVEVAGRRLAPRPVLVGVPHAVEIVPDVDAFADDAAFERIGRAVRLHPAFAPAGTNLDAIAVLDRRTLRMRTYERGVEAETLACGTGAVAGAVVATSLGLVAPPVTVVTRSGLPLQVEFAWDGVRAAEVLLAGEARIVAAGEIWPDALADQ